MFVRDRRSGTTQRVSVATDGTQANNDNYSPAISADGRYVTFQSDASNLVPGDTNGTWDVFVRDRQSGTTQRVNVATDGTQANSGSDSPAISADGRYVAFASYASNLVPGDTNHSEDVFVRDLKGAPPPPSNKFTVSRINTRADGTITFSVGVPGPGSVDVLETAWNDNFAREDPARARWCSSPPRIGSYSPERTTRTRQGNRDRHTQPAGKAPGRSSPLPGGTAAVGQLHPNRRAVPDDRLPRAAPPRLLRKPQRRDRPAVAHGGALQLTPGRPGRPLDTPMSPPRRCRLGLCDARSHETSEHAGLEVRLMS